MLFVSRLPIHKLNNIESRTDSTELINFCYDFLFTISFGDGIVIKIFGFCSNLDNTYV